jgi:hypothetical protein
LHGMPVFPKFLEFEAGYSFGTSVYFYTLPCSLEDCNNPTDCMSWALQCV